MLTLALWVSLQAPIDDVPPPPPLIDPALEEPAPVGPSPSPPLTPPPSPSPSPPPPPDRPKAKVEAQSPASSPGSLDGPLLVLAQCAAGTGVYCVGLPLALVPCVGTLVILAAIGGVETWVGDMFGKKRGAMLWPMLGTLGAAAASAVLGVGVYAVVLVIGLVGGGLFNNVGGGEAFGLLAAVYGGLAAYGLVTLALVVVTPAVVYGLTAVDKEPGDGGDGLPGLVELADPTGTRKRSPPKVAARAPRPRPLATAMAY